MLFLGIALMVYHYFFKLLGLILFAIEIGWFIVLPIVRELKAWWALRGAIREQGRAWVSVGILASLAAGLLIPSSDRIYLPAVLEASPHATIYAPAAGKIVELAVKQGQLVQAGDPLVMVEAPMLEKEIALTQKRIEVERLRAQRQSVDRENLAKTQETLETLRTVCSNSMDSWKSSRRCTSPRPLPVSSPIGPKRYMWDSGSTKATAGLCRGSAG